MDTHKPLTNALVQRVSASLQAQSFIAYADNKNLLIDLGWDVTSGDGEIATLAESLLESEIRNFPDHYVFLLWTETDDFEFEKIWLLQRLNESPKKVAPDALEAEEIYVQLTEHLKGALFRVAESAYEQHLEESDD